MSSLLPNLDYLNRLGGPVENALTNLESIRAFAADMNARLTGETITDSMTWSDMNQCGEDQDGADIRTFAMNELRQTLTRNWVHTGEAYFLHRGSSKREILVDVGLFEEEREELKAMLLSFQAALQSLPSLCVPNNHPALRGDIIGGLGDLFI